MSIMIENADFDRIVSLANRFGWTPGGIGGTFADAVRMIEEALDVRIDELDRMTAEAQPTHADSANAAPDVSGDAAYYDADNVEAGMAHNFAVNLSKNPEDALYTIEAQAREIKALTAANRALESKVAACLAIEVWVVEAGDIGYYEGEIVGWNEARDEFRAILLSDAAQAESDESDESEGARYER